MAQMSTSSPSCQATVQHFVELAYKKIIHRISTLFLPSPQNNFDQTTFSKLALRHTLPHTPLRLPPATSNMATSELIAKVSTYVENHMGQYDASHDFEHIKRVIGGAHIIYHEIIATEPEHPELDLNLITLSALLRKFPIHWYMKQC
jgi:hypothetical protein